MCECLFASCHGSASADDKILSRITGPAVFVSADESSRIRWKNNANDGSLFVNLKTSHPLPHSRILLILISFPAVFSIAKQHTLNLIKIYIKNPRIPRINI